MYIPKNFGKPWEQYEINKLILLTKCNIEIEKIAEELQRTTNEVYKEANELEISLKPREGQKIFSINPIFNYGL